MTISTYNGLPGSGKSYEVVRSVVLPALREGRTVYTNIPLDCDTLEAELSNRPVLFDIRDIQANERWFHEVLPAGALCIIDECWRLWPAGLKANNAVESHKEFLAEHRHMVGADGRSTEVVLVTQDAAQLAAFVRQLIEKTYRAKKLDVVGQDRRYRIDIYEGCVTGSNPPLDKRVREMYGEYKPEIYRLYKSHTRSETGAAGNEERADKRANVLRGGRFKAILAALVILPIFVGWGGYSTYQQFANGGKPTSVEVAAAAPAAPPPREKPQDGFLWDREVSIIMNRSDGRTIDYVFRVVNESGYVDLTPGELYTLGYIVTPVNQCLATISGHGGQQYAVCQSYQTAGIVERTADNITGRSM